MSTSFALAAARVRDGADPAAEAAALVADMTLDEKLRCLDGDTPFWPGLVDMTAGGYYRHPWPAAVVERIGVPGIQFADGPRGAVIADGTAFPVSMGRGALFDPAVEERIGDVIGIELRASGATFTGAVCMNLLRHPGWGRAQETYGEDPHHVGEMAAAFTRGLQRHVMACMKHFALNSMENARFRVDVEADERALHEVYLPHFRRVADEGVAATMSAYNKVNGEWCGENETLLTTILREEWGWDGFVISDFIFGLRDAVGSVRAGLDIEMPFRQQRAMALGAAVESGELDVADVDASVSRLVATLLRFAPLSDRSPSPAVVGSDPHRALAREVASAATVMLRNEGELLPVDPGAVRSLAVLGRLADTPNLGDGGSSDVKSTSVVTPLAGLTDAFVGADVRHVETPVAAADRQAVADADLVVVVVGYTKEDEGEYIDNEGTMALAIELFPPMDHPELGLGGAPADLGGGGATASGMAPGGDRRSLRLRADDEALIAAAVELNERVVVAVQCGSAVVMPWATSVPGLLVTWYPGVEGGHALADVITGAAEPGGRLPFAIPVDEVDLPEFDPDATSVTYDLFHGQWALDRAGTAAAYPFGSGFGFATFAVGPLELDDDAGAVRVTVENTGDRDGSTVVFVHAGLPGSTVERPPSRLVGFRRVAVPRRATATVTVDVDWRMLDVRRDGGWWTEPGSYEITVGQHAGDPVAVRLTVDRG